MKFSVNAQDIQEGISIVTRALPSKSINQIFECVYVEVSGNGITLTCTDGQFAIRWTGNVSVSEPGSTIIPGRMLSELIRKLPNATVTFKTDDKAVIITCGKSRSRLATIQSAFPEAKEDTEAHTFSIPAFELKELIGHIQSCIAMDDSRPILTGGLMEISHDAITMVALDGFRLAMKKTTVDNILPEEIGTVRAVVPRKSLTEIARALPTSEDLVSIAIGKNTIRFDYGSTQISSILLAGEYMDYSKIIPNDFTTQIRADKTALQEAIDRAMLMAREGKNNLIKLDITESEITISSRAENGNIEEEVECIKHGKDITISFNSNYLADAIKNIQCEDITLQMNTPTTPCVMTSDSALYLVLPVRTN